MARRAPRPRRRSVSRLTLTAWVNDLAEKAKAAHVLDRAADALLSGARPAAPILCCAVLP